MSIINSIPEKYQDGFKELAEINDEDFEKIQKALKQTSWVSSMEKLLLKTYELATIDFDLEDIFSSISSLIPFAENEASILEIIDNITELSIDNEIIKSEDKDKFKYRLNILLNGKQVFYASKAEDLISNYGNSFILSKIVSDIRPIFDSNIDNEIEAGIITHNLVIHYQSCDEPFHKDMTVTLTPTDLLTLKETLNRAEIKEKQLKRILEKSGIANLND